MTSLKVLGSPPITPWLFLVGKCAIAPHYVFVVLWAAGRAPAGEVLPGVWPFALLLALAGNLLLVVGVQHLGESIRVGLPDGATELKTHGLYRFSRNPIYLGLFLSGAGSCLLVPHWFNLAATAVMVAVHHRIVLAEERFLDARFGSAWHEYRARVRRYL